MVAFLGEDLLGSVEKSLARGFLIARLGMSSFALSAALARHADRLADLDRARHKPTRRSVDHR
jgi:hypothetical protein